MLAVAAAVRKALEAVVEEAVAMEVAATEALDSGVKAAVRVEVGMPVVEKVVVMVEAMGLTPQRKPSC